jgi:hypothetical protein
MISTTAQNENSTRIFRENPFAWYDKIVMRYLREKYGKDKKTFLILRAVYTALTEIESDFKERTIPFFTKTVGTYAGVSREAAGKYLNMLEDEGLITRVRERDPQTKKFLGGTIVHILSINPQQPTNEGENGGKIREEKEPLSGYPSTGLSQRWDTPANNKKISFSQENKSNVNGNFKNLVDEKPEKKRPGMQGVGDIMMLFDIVNQKQLSERPAPLPPKNRKSVRAKNPEEKAERDYFASHIATELADEKSLGCYRVIAEKVPQSVIFETLGAVKEMWKEGKIQKSRGALFVDIIKTYCQKKHIALPFSEGID